MQKLIDWCKQYGLFVIALFLLAFIPLYPKLPLINVIRTWVYIRLDDFLIAAAEGILVLILLKERRVPDSPLTTPIICYWVVGGVSLINSLIFIFPHLVGVFPHLGFLHYLRRFEYMLLFFVAYEAFRKKPILLPVLWSLIGSYFLVILYGFGQKFLGLPAFMTMNEQFAKGIPLRLPPTARIPSTFGGHYDLAAYLVLTIPIMGSLLVGLKKFWQILLFSLLTFLGLIMLLFTASRISFVVYLIAMSVMLIWQKKQILIVPMIILSIIILNFTSGASERFYKTFRVSDVVVDLSTGKPIGTLDKLEGTQATLRQSQSPALENLPTGSEYLNLAGGSSGEAKTVTLYSSKSITGATGEVATVSGSFLIQRALVYDISITTRFQAEWPQAIEAFKRNILLGSGYSSLSVATDGDYHRMLGETGIFGFIAFLGVLAASFLLFFKRRDSLGVLEKSFVIGVYAGIVGLMVNAVFIDVFESSKVAYTLWLLLGLSIAILVGKIPFKLNYFELLKKLATHKIAYVIYLLLALWLIWGKTFTMYFTGDDFTWLRWAAQSRFHDIIGYFTSSQGFFYRPIPKVWYFLLFSVFWLTAPVYHIMSIVLLSATVLLLFYLLRRLGVTNTFAWVGSLLFGVLSVHHENVYWISGQSSMLSAFFLLGSIVLIFESNERPRLSFMLFFTSIVSLLLSMMSYDGMLIAPVIVCLISLVYFKKKAWSWAYFVCIPLYWFMRSHADALMPQGDYGYKASTFLANSVGNTVGYTLSLFIGPLVMERWDGVHAALRPYLKEITVGIVVLAVGLAAFARRIWKRLEATKRHLVWFGFYILSLAAYVPLGNIAERYVYIASIFFIVGAVLLTQEVWKNSRMVLSKVLIIVITFFILGINIQEVERLGGDWLKAGSVVEQSLRVVKQAAFPPQNVLHFFIINTPIRYGRAWIFPTGMNDALWQIYRGSPYTVGTARSVEEGYNLPPFTGDRRVFIFENYVLKQGIVYSKEIVQPTAHETKAK